MDKLTRALVLEDVTPEEADQIRVFLDSLRKERLAHIRESWQQLLRLYEELHARIYTRSFEVRMGDMPLRCEAVGFRITATPSSGLHCLIGKIAAGEAPELCVVEPDSVFFGATLTRMDDVTIKNLFSVAAGTWENLYLKINNWCVCVKEHGLTPANLHNDFKWQSESMTWRSI